jgi:uncharacterized protein
MNIPAQTLEPLTLPSNGAFVDDRVAGLEDTFQVPLWGSVLLYQPRRGLLLWSTKEEFAAAIPELQDLAEPGYSAPTPIRDAPWAPTSVTFSNTQKCTLRCTYCYADGGRLDDAVLPNDIADSAISLIIENSLALGASPSINFLGEGEATADWASFTYIIEAFEKRCSEAGLDAYISLSSNGVFSPSRLPYLKEHINRITFSVDGLADAHDASRVLPNGKGSFRKVVSTMKACDLLGIAYDIRCTATVGATGALPGFVAWVAENLSAREIHVEPVFDNSPYALSAMPTDEPPPQAFVSAYREARRIGAAYGVSLYYSSADLRFKTGFCGVTGAENVIVTSKGIVTSCNEVLRADDPRADTFQYGAWDVQEKRILIDQDRVARLGKVDVRNIDKCQSCFAKFNCAGDCYAKTEAQYGDLYSPEYTPRCEVTRELTRDNLILRLLENLGDQLSEGQVVED